MLLDTLLMLVAVAVAVAMQPWRATGAGGPPWPWLACCAVLPVFWAADKLAASAIIQPLSGASLLVLLAGWPWAVLGLLPVTAVVATLGGLPWPEALHRLVWLGLVPGTLAMALGAAVRRWLPRHLFVYIMGRGFFTTWIAVAASGVLALGHWTTAAPPAGTEAADLVLARFLTASGEAFLTGMLTAIFVAFRPQWLATYSDRLYLPRD